MRKIIMIVMVIVCVGLNALELDDNFHFGFKGGLQNSEIKGGGIETKKARMTFAGEIFMIKAIDKGFYLQNGLKYQPIGAIDENEVNYKLDYVNTNLYLCYALPEENKQGTILSPFIGIDFGILANDKITLLGETVDVKDLSKTNFSLACGVNIISKENIVVSFAYNYGLTKIVDNKDYKDRYNRSMLFTIGYMLK